MSTVDASTEGTATEADAGTLDLRLEVVVLPVADVDRAKDFYTTKPTALESTACR